MNQAGTVEPLPIRQDLRFEAELSSRYHRRRATFLERCFLLLALATLVLSTTAFASSFGTGGSLAKISALLIAAVGLIQIVYRPETCAAAHRLWLRQWLAILSEVKSDPQPTALKLADWSSRAAAIEADCVGEMRALQADCYNRAVRALNRDTRHNYRLKPYHRALCQVISFEHAFEGEAAEPCPA